MTEVSEPIKHSLIHSIKGLSGGIYLGIRLWLGLVTRGGEDPQHSPCSPQCSDTKQEYILSEGYKVKIEEGEEVNNDLVLDPSPFQDCGTFSGRVKDRQGHFIENTLIKIFDINYHPVAHVYTNEEGEFLVCLPAGHYWVKVVQ